MSVVVITGAAGGIGQAMARAWAAEGSRVALLDLCAPTELAAELVAGGSEALAIACDITDEAACDGAIAQVLGRWGQIDVLINNAGISHRSLFESTDPAVLRKVMEVNFFGAVNCTRSALPSLVHSGGQIVAISSVAGFGPLLGRTAYSASKHAMHGFFDSLRTELAGRVGVLIVCPAYTDTALKSRALGADGVPLGESTRNTIGALLQPDDVARSVLRAVRRRRRMLLLSPVAHASWWLSRFAPRVYARLMVRGQRAEFASPTGSG